MSVILFIAILAILILVHELGHFIAARSVGARVDEFGIGFPPRAWAFRPKGGETEYSINWIPFGGFVKILGENGIDEIAPADMPRSITSKNRLAQVWVLAAGVIFNIALAWVLLAASFMTGVLTTVAPDTQGLVGAPQVMILETFEGGPAARAGLEPGDVIVSVVSEDGVSVVPQSVVEVQDIIGSSAGAPLTVVYERDGAEQTLEITPAISGEPRDGFEHAGVIGVSLDLVGTVKLGFFEAILEAGRASVRMLVAITQGLGSFVVDAFSGDADYAQVSGPVGIVSMVGDVSSRGLVALVSFAAVISLNLAVINLVPFPALDGGRILFVTIEAIIRRPLPMRFTQWANVIGFGVLIILMIAITINDIIKLA